MSRPKCELPLEFERDDPTLLFLSGLFRRLAPPLIGGVLLSGCSAAEQSLDGRSAALDANRVHCVDGRWRPMSALALDQDVDYASLRHYTGTPHPFAQVVDAAGAPCARAAKPRVCEAEMRRVSLSSSSETSMRKPDQQRSHLLVTQAGTVRALRTLAEKLELLGMIDTPDEALLVIEHEDYPISCGDTGGTRVEARSEGYRITATDIVNCQPSTVYTLDVSREGVLTVASTVEGPAITCGSAGRRPPNLVAAIARRAGGRALGRYFASAARLEAASVDAFEQLQAELRAFGAPQTLRSAARVAAEDEVRHAHATAALAERFGARPGAPVLTRRRLRGLAEVALDNALEGCVGETYGAYLASLQARLASDPALKQTLAEIARDETRHAALSWQLAGWLEPQLDARARRYIASARCAAIAALGAPARGQQRVAALSQHRST